MTTAPLHDFHPLGHSDRLALASELWDASDAFTIEAALSDGKKRKQCRRAARQLATVARLVLRDGITGAEALAFTEASRKALGWLAGARHLRDALNAPQTRQNGANDA